MLSTRQLCSCRSSGNNVERTDVLCMKYHFHGKKVYLEESVLKLYC